MGMDFFIGNYDFLTGNEKRVLHYILDNQKNILNLTCSKIALDCSVSKTVVITMAQKLDFDGFNDLKFFLKNYKTKEKSTESDIRQALIGNVTKTLDLNKDSLIEKAANCIANASCVYIIARGTSKSCSAYLGHLLLLLNIKCIIVPDYNLLNVIANQLQENEIFIAISLSGKTNIIVDTAKLVNGKGNKMISISSFTNNELEKYADVSLYCYSQYADTKNFDIISRLGVFTIIDQLIYHIMNR